MKGQKGSTAPEAISILQEMNENIQALRLDFRNLQGCHNGSQEQHGMAQAEIAELNSGTSQIFNTTRPTNFFESPSSFSGKQSESVDSFIAHLNLYLQQIPEDQNINVADSYLCGDAYNWYQMVYLSPLIAKKRLAIN